MALMDRLEAMLNSRVEAAVARALADHEAKTPHGADPQNLLYRPRIHGKPERLHLDESAVVNNALFNLSGGEITVGKNAFFGHYVSILTGTHEVEKFGAERREAIVRQGRDVVVGEGVWLASHVVVVGPCTIGEHSVVGVGSLVLDDVEPYSVVAGSPAKVIRRLERPPSEPSPPREA